MPKAVSLSNSTPRVPSYRLHKPTGQAVVTFCSRDIYLGKYGTKDSRAEYGRLVGEWMANDGHLPSADADLSIAELAQRYWKFSKTYYVKDGRPTSMIHTVRRALQMLRKNYGHTRVADFGPLALESLQAQMIGQGLCRSTINAMVACIRRAFRWGVAKQIVPVTVYQALTAVSGLRQGRTTAREPQPVQPVADETVEATLLHLPPVVADMVRFQRLTGARPGEVCQLRPRDIDRSKEVWAYRPESHKTQHHGRERVIFIGPKAQALLRPYLLRSADSFCFSPTEGEARRHDAMRSARKSKVQPSQRNRRKTDPKRKPRDCYVKDGYCRAVVRACELAFGMPKELRNIDRSLPEAEKKRLRKLASEWRAKHGWSPNQLRHSAATEIRRQFGLEAAQVALGHSSADVTQVYAERDWALAAAVARRIG